MRFEPACELAWGHAGRNSETQTSQVSRAGVTCIIHLMQTSVAAAESGAAKSANSATHKGVTHPGDRTLVIRARTNQLARSFEFSFGCAARAPDSIPFRASWDGRCGEPVYHSPSFAAVRLELCQESRSGQRDAARRYGSAGAGTRRRPRLALMIEPDWGDCTPGSGEVARDAASNAVRTASGLL
jgi:hypothetical protein